MTNTVPPLDKKNQHAAIYSNGEKILFEPLTGYVQYVPLPDSKRKIFNLSDLSIKQLGIEVRKVLANSRVLDISEIDDFFDDERLEKDINECFKIMTRLFEKKNKTDLNRHMMQIPSHLDNEIISFRPTKHVRSDIYSGLSLDDKELVYIPSIARTKK